MGSSQSGERKRHTTRLKKSIDLSAFRSPHIIAVQKGNFWALGSMFGFRLSANVAVRPIADVSETTDRRTAQSFRFSYSAVYNTFNF